MVQLCSGFQEFQLPLSSRQVEHANHTERDVFLSPAEALAQTFPGHGAFCLKFVRVNTSIDLVEPVFWPMQFSLQNGFNRV